MAERLKVICLSGAISPNLVTLVGSFPEANSVKKSFEANFFLQIGIAFLIGLKW